MRPFQRTSPNALQLCERADVIDATLAREALRLAEDRAAEAEQLRIQEADLRAQIEALGYTVAARGTAGLGLSDVQQDVVVKRELYSLLLARLAEAEQTELPTTARVIATAVPPVRPVVPDWRLLLGAAAGAALLLSAALVVFDARKRRAAR